MLFWIFVFVAGVVLLPFIIELLGLSMIVLGFIAKLTFNWIISPAVKLLGSFLLFLNNEQTYSQRTSEIKTLWSKGN